MRILGDFIEDLYLFYKNGCYGLVSHILKDVALCLVTLVLGCAMAGPFGVLAFCGAVVYSVSCFAIEIRTRKRLAGNRGQVMVKFSRAQRAANRLRRAINPTDRGVHWGKLRIPSEDSTHHFLVVGSIGSGKTLTFRILMNDQLTLITAGSDFRALVYDNKGDMLPIIQGTQPNCPVHILNPFDARHSAWKLARDIDTPIAALDFAVHLIPRNEFSSQRFFEDAPRVLVTAVLRVFIATSPGTWTFRQLILVMLDGDLLRSIVARDQGADATVRHFLSMTDEAFGNVMASIVAKLAHFEAIAAAWEHSHTKFSIKDWMLDSSILVLGNNELARETMNLVNSLIVTFAGKFALNQVDSRMRRTFFFLDEFAECGQLNVSSIILRGRSKGCCVLLGFQDLESLHSAYGREEANALVGQCGNKAFLKISSEHTARWAAGLINKTMDWDALAAGQETREEHPERAFMSLPQAGRENGLHGVFMSRAGGCWKAHYTPQELTTLVGATDPSFPAFVPTPVSWQTLAPWNERDARQFGIPWIPPHNGAAPQPVTPPHTPTTLAAVNRFTFRSSP